MLSNSFAFPHLDIASRNRNRSHKDRVWLHFQDGTNGQQIFLALWLIFLIHSLLGRVREILV